MSFPRVQKTWENNWVFLCAILRLFFGKFSAKTLPALGPKIFEKGLKKLRWNLSIDQVSIDLLSFLALNEAKTSILEISREENQQVLCWKTLARF